MIPGFRGGKLCSHQGGREVLLIFADRQTDNQTNKQPETSPALSDWLLGETKLMKPILENVPEMLYISNQIDSCSHIISYIISYMNK